MITKPEDAVPHTDFREVIKNLTVSVAVPSFVSGAFTGEIAPFFTAAECAEIARAYGEACAAFERGEVDIMPMALPEAKDQWLAKFTEWEGK